MFSPDPVPTAIQEERRNTLGWCMYDWANSAYITTVAVGLLPAYFARSIVGPGGVAIGGTMVSATTLWGITVSVSALLAFLIAPVLGAVADFSSTKKQFLLFFAYLGSLATTLLYFSRTGEVLLTLVLFLIAQTAFTAGNVFYDAFLPEISSGEQMDRTSGRGFAFGYIGGGLQFALALGLVAGHELMGISQGEAARIGIGTAGLWWAGFTLYTARYLRERRRPVEIPAAYRAYPRFLAYAATGVARTWATTRRISRFRHLLLFLIAFMFYNDGIQTVIDMATIYGTEELGLSNEVLMLTLLVIQGIAALGALVFSWLAARMGTKSTIMLTLLLWLGVVSYAYFIHTAAEYFTLGAVVGIVLGGSQALSRSFYGSMIPPGASAEFYGFYTVFTKLSAFWGPLAFAMIRQASGSARLSMVSLVVFFLGGMVLLHFVDERRAREARLAVAF
ncbi:MAG: MFS transporter [Acidobacteria bacterium]|nr:MFS transporter [Acidobacteriota bacterium]